MGTREKDHTAPHQPLLSSLVIRPADNGVGAAGGAGGGGGDYEPGEVRGDAPLYSRSDRFHDDYATDVVWYKKLGGHRFRGFGNGRDPGRYRDYSPPHYSRGRDGARFGGRDYDGPKFGPGNFKGDGGSRNNPNVRPREGDWLCPDPACKNLNFARREFCNNCKRPRYASGGGSPRRGHHPGLPYHPPPRRFAGPPSDRSPPPPGRFMNGHRSPPPRVWDRDDEPPRDLRAPPYPRRESRLADPPLRKDRGDYPPPLDGGYEERSRFDRSMPTVDWGGSRDRGRDGFLNDRKGGGYERRMPSPPFPSSRGQWDREYRDRSRSPPVRGDRRDMYIGRGIDDRRGIARGAY